MSNKRVHGFTLVEMVIAIVILGVALSGTLLALNTVVRSSSDPLIHKQMLAVAEEMLEEILLKPYKPNGVAPANSLRSCGVAPVPTRSAFDDIRDYDGYQTTGICTIDGGAVGGLESYNVAVSAKKLTWSLSSGDINDSILVSVTVKHGTETLSLEGRRTCYAVSLTSCDSAS